MSKGTLPPLTEKAFMAQVVQAAALFGWVTYHTHDSRHSAAGYPDLTLVRPPRLVFAECKSESGKVTPAQATWLRLLRDAGQEVYLWRPSAWDEIEAALR
jgi:hypothetical protein